MTTYQFRWLNEKGDAPTSMKLECATALQAIGVAERQTGDHELIEVWDGVWLVCRYSNRNKTRRG
jgi:hypothetical protein